MRKYANIALRISTRNLHLFCERSKCCCLRCLKRTIFLKRSTKKFNRISVFLLLFQIYLFIELNKKFDRILYVRWKDMNWNCQNLSQYFHNRIEMMMTQIQRELTDWWTYCESRHFWFVISPDHLDSCELSDFAHSLGWCNVWSMVFNKHDLFDCHICVRFHIHVFAIIW